MKVLLRSSLKRRTMVAGVAIMCTALLSTVAVLGAEQTASAVGKERVVAQFAGSHDGVAHTACETGETGDCAPPPTASPTASPDPTPPTPTPTPPTPTATPVPPNKGPAGSVTAATGILSSAVPPKPNVTNDDGRTVTGCEAYFINAHLEAIEAGMLEVAEEFLIVLDAWQQVYAIWELAMVQYLNDAEDTDPSTNSPHPGPPPEEPTLDGYATNHQTMLSVSYVQQALRSVLRECDPAAAPGGPCAPVAALYHSYLATGVDMQWGQPLPDSWAVHGIPGTVNGYGALSTDELMACFCLGSGDGLGPPSYFPTGFSESLINWTPEEDAGDPHSPQNHPCVDWANGQLGGSGGELPDNWSDYWNDGDYLWSDFANPGRPSWFLMVSMLGFSDGDEPEPPVHVPGDQIAATLNGVVVGTWVFTGGGCFTFVGSGGNTNPELGAIDDPPGERCPDSQ